MFTLLDPKNDYVFKRLFAGNPELTVALIDDLRPDLPRVESVEILNPTIDASELGSKGIVLDVRARCVDGHQYNIEMQVQRQRDWGARSLFEHWQEESVMADVTHEPVKKAMGSIRQLSADEEAQRLAEAREWGRINWNLSIGSARREGLEEGLEQGREEGLEEGQRRTLQRLLTRRFGELPARAAELLESATAEQMEVWTDEILVAGSLEEVFEGGSDKEG